VQGALLLVLLWVLLLLLLQRAGVPLLLLLCHWWTPLSHCHTTAARVLTPALRLQQAVLLGSGAAVGAAPRGLPLLPLDVLHYCSNRLLSRLLLKRAKHLQPLQLLPVLLRSHCGQPHLLCLGQGCFQLLVTLPTQSLRGWWFLQLVS
jgi:hypothetical protein